MSLLCLLLGLIVGGMIGVGCSIFIFAGYAERHFTMMRWIGIDRCGDCIKCADEIDADCPFAGEPNGCNNRECAEYVNKFGGKK